MSRSTKGLKLLPQLYKNKAKLGESMIIEENREAWRIARKENIEKLRIK